RNRDHRRCILRGRDRARDRARRRLRPGLPLRRPRDLHPARDPRVARPGARALPPAGAGRLVAHPPLQADLECRMPTAIIAEDEPILREQLEAKLRKLWPDLEIVASVEDGAAALEALEARAPDFM